MTYQELLIVQPLFEYLRPYALPGAFELIEIEVTIEHHLKEYESKLRALAKKYCSTNGQIIIIKDSSPYTINEEEISYKEDYIFHPADPIRFKQAISGLRLTQTADLPSCGISGTQREKEWEKLPYELLRNLIIHKIIT